MDYKISVRWTNQAVADLEEILQYLGETVKEINKFKSKLGEDIELLMKFPYLDLLLKPTNTYAGLF